MDIENELCLKCQNISIDTDETSGKSSSNSPISQNLKQIENELSKQTKSDSLASLNENNYNFKYLETFLSDLPINIIEIPTITTTATNEMMCSLESISSNESHQFVLNNNKNKLIDTKNTFSLLLSSSNNNNNNKPMIKRRIKEKTSPNTKFKTTATTTTITAMDTSVNTPLRMLGKNSVSTTKKRSWDSTSSTEILNSTDINNKLDIEPKTPKTKRRLIMSTTNQSMLQSPSSTINNGTVNSCNNIASPRPNSKTILHYFSPVIQPK